MLGRLRQWWGRTPDTSAGGDGPLLRLRGELRGLRLEVEERDRTIAALRADHERLRRDEGGRVEQAVAARLERLLADAAGPVAQLHTQAHLVEQGRPVSVRDVVAVAGRLERSLEEAGLTREGRVGETVGFDPNRHEPLGVDVNLRSGDAVVVRLVGVGYRGKLLRKAGVEPAGG